MRRGGGSASRVVAADVEPLDEAEQSALVAELARASAAQARFWRACFGGVGMALAALFAWAAVWQALKPWQLVFHADFYGVLPAIAVAAADACAAACVGAASAALLRAAAQPLRPESLPPAEPPRTAAALAVATSAFWGIAWVRLLRLRATQADAAPASDALKLLWLPMAPLYTLLCEHVERSVQDTAATVATLRDMQYRYKAL